MNLTKKLTTTCSTISLGTALLVVIVLGTKLHRVDGDLKSAKADGDQTVAMALAIAADHAAHTCSGSADDQPVDVSVGQTIVTPRGEKLTCTRDRVMVYSHV